MKHLILGGVRAGKSRYAERCARSSGMAVTYIATALAADAEMRGRIAEHQRSRPAQWRTVEAPYELVTALHREAHASRCVIVDCLTLWLTQCLCQRGMRQTQDECDALVDTLVRLPGVVLFVSNETGLGVVPMGELSRQFCDLSGNLHQGLAQVCDAVTLMVAGLPVIVKEKRA
jgi:adenosylcobinamide kinase/adenosylcobinamide-phosphate guanylyltransferase